MTGENAEKQGQEAPKKQRKRKSSGQQVSAKVSGAPVCRGPKQFAAVTPEKRSCTTVEKFVVDLIDGRYTPSDYASLVRASEAARPAQSLVAARTGRTYGPAPAIRVRLTTGR
jgi:hypothetical protein